ncbi:MAG: tetratricopeptide repeat protein [Candidatus Eisenbacteria bacterium]|nr:tetratricopeptide repeat protein [Candidatus Latescibacterota bacterium]MBD3302073.1 tetratricopeptide repeat protein [Candidatus Eisenbacteria bacterium]
MNTESTREREIRVLLDAATADRIRGRVADAEQLLEEALAIARSEDRPELVAAVRASQGVLERNRGNLDSANVALAEALDLRRQVADPLGIARALGDLGRVHLDAGRSSEASRCIEEALETSSGPEPGRTRAEILENAGLLHARLGSPDRAEECLLEARSLYDQLDDVDAVDRIDAFFHRRDREAGRGEGPAVGLDEELQLLERRRLLEALEAEGWNQSRAARRLGVTETRVRNLMRRHGLRPRNRRGRPRKSADRSTV